MQGNSRGMGLAFFLCGAGLSSYRVVWTMITVRRLVLTYIAIQTYGVTWGGGKGQNVPVVHCSGIQHTFYGKHRFLLKVRDHSIKYQLNLEEGVVSNKPLFDRTVGISRSPKKVFLSYILSSTPVWWSRRRILPSGRSRWSSSYSRGTKEGVPG